MRDYLTALLDFVRGEMKSGKPRHTKNWHDGLTASRFDIAPSDLQRLTVTIRVTGDQLPRPILVHQVYRRKS